MSEALAQAPAVVLDGCHVATVDASGTEHASGHVVLEGGRVTAVGRGSAPNPPPGATTIDATGCLVTPGLATPTTTSTSGSPAGWRRTAPCSAG